LVNNLVLMIYHDSTKGDPKLTVPNDFMPHFDPYYKYVEVEKEESVNTFKTTLLLIAQAQNERIALEKRVKKLPPPIKRTKWQQATGS